MPPPVMPISPKHELVRQLLPRGVSYYGPLDRLTHDEFAAVVARHGGRFVRYAHRGPFRLLVLGEGDLPVTPAGDPVDFGDRTVLAEGEFLELLGERAAGRAGEADPSFTAAALAELLRVPAARVMAWAKAGLLRPRAADHGVPRFDFRQAAVARTLVQLAAAGVTPGKIRQSLRRLARWLPDLAEPLQQLAVLERNGPLLVRLETGELAEVDGQMRLDFAGDAAPAPQPVPLFAARRRSAMDWHAEGIGQERAGLLADAVESYRQALLAGGPDAQVCFDLAHALAAAGEREQAAERYRQVSELDPDRADAWNNLGVVLGELGDAEGAAEAFRHAVRLDPDDPMARYNLADTLDDLGATAEAAEQFDEYLRLDPGESAWTEHARARRAGT